MVHDGISVKTAILEPFRGLSPSSGPPFLASSGTQSSPRPREPNFLGIVIITTTIIIVVI